jgi:hypothetical protein
MSCKTEQGAASSASAEFIRIVGKDLDVVLVFLSGGIVNNADFYVAKPPY